jgi:hypothetical protein
MTRAQARRENDFHFVIAGLDPAIHAVPWLLQPYRKISFASFQHGPPGQARW